MPSAVAGGPVEAVVGGVVEFRAADTGDVAAGAKTVDASRLRPGGRGEAASAGINAAVSGRDEGSNTLRSSGGEEIVVGLRTGGACRDFAIAVRDTHDGVDERVDFIVDCGADTAAAVACRTDH